jgi:energy-coupling factor transporter ATP-binding protein EcfA2
MIKKPVTNKQIIDCIDKHSKIIYPSRFAFLNEHLGIRPGCLHGLLGTTGSGKSSLLRSIISDTAEHSKVLVWLSEEQVDDYQLGIIQTNKNVNLSNLLFFEETGLGQAEYESVDETIDCFCENAIKAQVDVIFLDNLTTSFMYSDNWGVRGQGKVIERLHDFTIETGIPIFFAIHTRKDVGANSRKEIVGEDIRGNNQAFQKTQYFYVLQRFSTKGGYQTFISIKKNRHHTINQNTFYLNFNRDRNYYDRDKAVSFEAFNKAFKDRDFLGKFDESDQPRRNGNRGRMGLYSS